MQANQLTFGVPVITSYSNGKITAKITHGKNEVLRAKVSYDNALSSNDNHLQAALKCIEKARSEVGKDFEIIAHTYNEKDTGYCFVALRK